MLCKYATIPLYIVLSQYIYIYKIHYKCNKIFENKCKTYTYYVISFYL